MDKNKSDMFFIKETKNQPNINNIKEKVIEINKNLVKLDKNVNILHNVEQVNNYIDDINIKVEEAAIPIVKNTHVNKNKLFDKIGILDPEGLQNNPLTGEPYSEKYIEVAKKWSNFPMYAQKDEVIDTIYNNRCILVTAGTGSGKTVLIPKYTLHTFNYQGKIAITIPRRAATLAAAGYAAITLDVPLGEQVGYMVKDDKKAGPRTNLVYATDGYILAKMKGGDPNLSEYDALIIDEVHERNVNMDLLLLLVKGILRNRPNFKLILMSATIDPKIFTNYYKEFGMIHFEGKSESYFSVNEIFLPPGKGVNKFAPNGEILSSKPPAYMVKALDIIFNDIIKAGKPGDILVLFPSKNDCSDACRLLEELINKEKKMNTTFSNKPFCIQLYSSSKNIKFRNATAENYAVGDPSYKNFEEGFTRRIVMATEVAESSLTFKGDPIDWVIDTGLSNSKIYYPDTELDALEKRYIAKANHKQRIGRTGRYREGTCYNVFTEAEYKLFLEYPTPPIMEQDITKEILNFMSLSNITHIDLPFQYVKTTKTSNVLENETLNVFLTRLIEPPHLNYVNNAIKKLFLLGVLSVNDGKAFLSPFGHAIGLFREIDPPKAACIIHSYNYKCSNQVIDLMALLNELEDDFGGIINEPKMKKDAPGSKEKMNEFKGKLKKLASSYGDHITLHNIMETYKEKTYDIKWERGRQELVSKSTGEMGEGTIWAKENYINSKSLQNAFKLSKDLNKSLGQVIGTYKRNNPEKSEDKFIFRDTAPPIHDKIDDNIMQCITMGYVSNIAKKTGNRYSTCFPEVSISADIDRNSLFNYITVKPINCIFSKSISIFGNKKFQTFSKIPIKVIDNLNQGEKNIVKECGKSAPKNFNKKQSQGKGQQGQKRTGKDKGQYGKKRTGKDKGQYGQKRTGKDKGQYGQKRTGKDKGQRGKKKTGGSDRHQASIVVNDNILPMNLLDIHPASFIV
jgi:HrpA-like RNA helicase